MNYELSFWGVALTLVLWVLAVALFVLIDRKEMLRVLKISGLMVAQMIVIGAGVWIVYKMDTWWANLLWLVVMLALATAWCVHELRGERPVGGKKVNFGQVLPVVAGLIAGCAVAGGSLMLTLPSGCLVPVFGVLIAHLMMSVTQTLQTYQRSMLHTEAHRQYMLANGASRLESLMPCVRRALRAAIQPQLKTMAQPLLVAMPLLFAGLLLGGVSPVAAVTVLLLFAAAAFVASVLAGVVALYCFKR